jgi:hypothetical protein
MAILHSSRARQARGFLQTYLVPARALRVASSCCRAEEQRVSSTKRSPLVLCPCDRCPSAAMCCDLQLACRAFGQFVRGVQWRGTARKPTHARYLRVFGSEGSGVPPC